MFYVSRRVEPPPHPRASEMFLGVGFRHERETGALMFMLPTGHAGAKEMLSWLLFWVGPL